MNCFKPTADLGVLNPLLQEVFNFKEIILFLEYMESSPNDQVTLNFGEQRRTPMGDRPDHDNSFEIRTRSNCDPTAFRTHSELVPNVFVTRTWTRSGHIFC